MGSLYGKKKKKGRKNGKESLLSKPQKKRKKRERERDSLLSRFAG